MDAFEGPVHSFVVKIWLEEQGDQRHGATWRGHVSHLPEEARWYVQELGEICACIVPYLVAMGVRVRFRWRLWQLLIHWFHRPSRPRAA